MSGDVVVGWVHPGHVDAGFMDSVLRMIDHDRGNDGRIAGYAGVHCSANVSSGRNRLADWFLNGPANWLLMADTDMVWPADSLDRLLANADPARAPIVGGLCFAREFETGRVWPTLFHREPLDGGAGVFVRHDQWPADTLMRVGGTGAAFLLVHRSVMEAVRERAFSAAYPWFQETENAVGKVSEDLTFCLRAAAVGARLFVHTGVRVGHVKTRVIGAADYLAQQMGATPDLRPPDDRRPEVAA